MCSNFLQRPRAPGAPAHSASRLCDLIRAHLYRRPPRQGFLPRATVRPRKVIFRVRAREAAHSPPLARGRPAIGHKDVQATDGPGANVHGHAVAGTRAGTLARAEGCKWAARARWSLNKENFLF
jgi:hypothetical protein